VNRVIKTRLRDKVLVTTKDGAAFAGVLFEADDKALVLRNAQALGAADDKSNVPLDGEVLILLADVAYIQKP
jgi:small nuclear ribonucleoprotein (snRNP)-like protein